MSKQVMVGREIKRVPDLHKGQPLWESPFAKDFSISIPIKCEIISVSVSEVNLIPLSLRLLDNSL